MSFKRFTGFCLLLLCAMGTFQPVKAEEIEPAPAAQVSAYALILAVCGT